MINIFLFKNHITNFKFFYISPIQPCVTQFGSNLHQVCGFFYLPQQRGAKVWTPFSVCSSEILWGYLFNPDIFLCLSEARTWISIFICCGLICVQCSVIWDERWFLVLILGDLSTIPGSLLKLSFYNSNDLSTIPVKTLFL